MKRRIGHGRGGGVWAAGFSVVVGLVAGSGAVGLLSAAAVGLLLTGGSVGGIVGALVAGRMSRRFGSARGLLLMQGHRAVCAADAGAGVGGCSGSVGLSWRRRCDQPQHDPALGRR